MSTADNATITLAAQIGQQRPGLASHTIAVTAGKLVKICASLRKRLTDKDALYDRAETLAQDVGARFMTHIPYGMPDNAIQFWLKFDDKQTVEIEI